MNYDTSHELQADEHGQPKTVKIYRQMNNKLRARANKSKSHK